MAEIFTQARLDDLLAKVNTIAELNEVEALWKASTEAKLLAAKGKMRENSIRFLKVLDRMSSHVAKLSKSAGLLDNSALNGMRAEIGAIHAQFHDAEGIRKTFVSTDGLVEVKNDEVTTPSDATPEPLPPIETPLDTPSPLNTSRYPALADEYVQFFAGARVRSSHDKKVTALADRAASNRNRYEDAGGPLGIPWWFIAGIHMLESTFNFTAHLHNGDPLRQRTVRVPAGRPGTGNPPFTWEDSAADALRGQSLADLKDWSLPRALWRWERYNGFGYRKRLIPTPYLWSFSSIYLRGKYTSDGNFDGGATSAQCGAAVLLKALQEKGLVDLATDAVAEIEPPAADTPKSTGAAPAPDKNTDEDAAPAHPFEAFFRAELSDIKNFTWREFLYKGNSHATNKLNTDPPQDLWPNVIPLARALDRFREEVGAPVRLTSVYRSAAYNKSLSGSAKRSQHMAFRAADIQVVGKSNTKEWAKLARKLRDEGVFTGGIGTYKTFIHIDTRGHVANW